MTPPAPTRRTRLLPAAALALGLAVLVAPPPALANRKDQKAADLYNDGVALIRKGKYREGAEKINEALARGATEPNDEQGSQSRFLARRYDPYYWLGVAQMETGLHEQALANFEKSLSIVPVGRSQPMIKGWPEEYADLERRMAVLMKRLEAPPQVARAPEPTRPPVPTAAPALPEATPAPAPTSAPTALAIRIERTPAAGTAVAPTKAPDPGRAAAEERLNAYRAWMADEVTGPAARPLLEPRLGRLEEALRQPSAAGTDRLLSAEAAAFARDVAPVLRAAALRAALDAYSRQDWPLLDAHLARARRAAPGAPQPDALECAAQSTRFVLGGGTDAGALAAARAARAAWRAKAGPSAPLPAILSPSLRAALGPEGPS